MKKVCLFKQKVCFKSQKPSVYGGFAFSKYISNYKVYSVTTILRARANSMIHLLFPMPLLGQLGVFLWGLL